MQAMVSAQVVGSAQAPPLDMSKGRLRRGGRRRRGYSHRSADRGDEPAQLLTTPQRSTDGPPPQHSAALQVCARTCVCFSHIGQLFGAATPHTSPPPEQEGPSTARRRPGGKLQEIAGSDLAVVIRGHRVDRRPGRSPTRRSHARRCGWPPTLLLTRTHRARRQQRMCRSQVASGTGSERQKSGAITKLRAVDVGGQLQREPS